jgi:DnaD/phage-associated family protein
MPIIKIGKKREQPFVQIDRGTIENPALSWQAKGLLTYLVGKPEDWTINVADLVNHATNGRDANYSILKELIAARYINRTMHRNPETKQFEQVVYLVSEYPLPEKPDTAFPYRGNQEGNNIDGSNREEEEGAPQNIFTLYQNNINPTYGQLLADELADYEDTHPYPWLEKAFGIAVFANVRKWSYVKAILDRWEVEGYDAPLQSDQTNSTSSTLDEVMREWIGESA